MAEQTAHARNPIRRWWTLWVVGGVDHDAVLRQIAQDSGWSGRYAFLIVVSAAISLLGLLMPSVAVLIGAMLLSPLMMPIIGLGFGIATFDTREMRRAATALIAGAVIAIALSVVFVTLSPVQTITSEIAGRTRPTLFDLLVALLSAVAGAYALIRGRGNTVVGVAIAIALMPPLAVVGFGIATANWTVFSGALLLFLTNAVTIALTAAIVARLYGFGSHLSHQHTGWQLALFVGALGVLSIPLVAALRQRTLFGERHDQRLDLVLQRGDGRLDIGGFGQRDDLGLIGEDHVDHAAIDQRMEIGAVTVDHELGRGGEGDLAARLPRDFDRGAHRGAGLFGVPQIAFDIEIGRIRDQRAVQRLGGQIVRCAEEGVHRPLAIGADKDHAARRGRLPRTRRRVETDARRANVVREDLA